MPTWKVHLFGQFRICGDEQSLSGSEGSKTQELLCYLLIHRRASYQRDHLAGMFWGECSTAQSRKYLRQALWRLHAVYDAELHQNCPRLLQVSSESVMINPAIDLWTDVADFEQAYVCLQKSGAPDAECFEKMRQAVDLYCGDLLEGWDQDWVLFERVRLQNIYLVMLDKLIGYCESRRRYEDGLDYGERALHQDPTRERTHQQMMRLHYLSGDRIGALRQFECCVALLKKELGVGPTRSTLEMYEQIRRDQLAPSPLSPSQAPPPAAPPEPSLFSRLEQLHTALIQVQQQIQQEINRVEQLLCREKSD